MSLSKSIAVNEAQGALLEKVILGNDLSGLSPLEKVQHVKNICDSLGLNPLTKPILLAKFDGSKEVPYCTKDGTEQLRKNHKVSVYKIETNMLPNEVYVVTAYVSTPDGRTDVSTGTVALAGLKGVHYPNAIMKAETKAKRRATLSICGLGFMDESEIESIPNAVKVDIYSQQEIKVVDVTESPKNDDYKMFKLAIETCIAIDDVQDIYNTIKEKKASFKTEEQVKQYIELMDMIRDKKNQIITKDFEEEIK